MFNFNIKVNNFLLNNLIKIFKYKRREVFILPKKGEPVILLLSGGLDSVSLFNYLCSVYKSVVYPIYIKSSFFSYSQFKSAKFFTDFFKKKYKYLAKDLLVINHSFFFSFQNLTKTKIVNQKFFKLLLLNTAKLKGKNEYFPFIISTPSRLGFYAFFAYEYLLYLRYFKNVDVKTIFVGLVHEDSIIRESSLPALLSINLSLCEIINDYSIQFCPPIDKNNRFFLPKKTLVKKAISDGIPLIKSFSCSKISFFHCGKCINCLTRKKVLSETGYQDKTFYLSDLKFLNYIKKLRQILRKIY